MPLYRDDPGRLYHSFSANLTGEAVRPGAIQMPEDAWLRVARVHPVWVERLPHASVALVVLSALLLLALVPLWYLVGPVAGGVAMIGVWLILTIGYYPLLAMASKQVAMDRPLRLIVPQPGGLIALELLRLWGAMIPLAGVVVMCAQDEDRADMVPWMLLTLGVMAVVVLVLNVRFVLRLRGGDAIKWMIWKLKTLRLSTCNRVNSIMFTQYSYPLVWRYLNLIAVISPSSSTNEIPNFSKVCLME